MEQPKNNYNIAILSPNKDAYSETFINAHKSLLSGNIYYLYGGLVPSKYEHCNKNKYVACKLLRFFYKGLEFILKKEFYFEEKMNLSRFLKKHKIDIVLAEYGLTGGECLEPCKKNNIPIIVHFHGYDASQNEVLSTYRRKYQELFEYAVYVIAVSKVMVDQLKKLGCSDNKIILNTYGPSEIFFKLNPISNSSLFLSVGRFVDKKAPYLTLLAFFETLKSFPDAKLSFVGNGHLLNCCINLCNYLNISKSVEFLGIQSPENIRDLMANSIAYVQHSITALNGDMEGTPVAILEASASALPVVSTYHAGISDVIINEKTGLLVEEKDVSGMATNMKRILANKEFARKLGEAGRENIKENFSIRKHIEVLDKLIVDSSK